MLTGWPKIAKQLKIAAKGGVCGYVYIAWWLKLRDDAHQPFSSNNPRKTS